MQDLLNENEFIQTKTYNPWKRYMIFYIIATVHAVLIFITTLFNEPENIATLFSCTLYFISPLIVPFILALGKKNFIKSGLVTTILGVALLNFIYPLLFIIIIWLRGEYIFVDESPMTIALGIVVLTFLCTLLIIPIIIGIRAILIKKHKKKEEKALEVHKRYFS
ncbi:hypothetical protein [Flavobacterium alkalisoli]|uniref:hypothetical protein n=1 Tax=Flavobacterium alkalisoli TaxID=2602769 RepID=UPI003A92D6A0